MLPSPALIQSIGKKLMAARAERDLTVEDIEFKTHIPAARIRELENDDFSNFANLTYAKGFLKIYSNYLNLDLDEYLDQFSTREFANISGHDYIQSANTGMTSISMAVAAPRSGGMNVGLWIILLLVGLAIGVPVYYWSRSTAEPAPIVKPQEIVPKAKVIGTAPDAPANVTPAGNAGTPDPGSPPAPKIEIKTAEPASIRAKVIPEDPKDAPPPPRNDVTNPPSSEDQPKKPTSAGTQVRKALSEFAGEPTPNR